MNLIPCRAVRTLTIAVLLPAFLIGCGSGAQVGRIGPPLSLPTGQPQNQCEREEWYELAPARLRVSGATAGIGYNTYYSAVQEGAGVFRPGQEDPEELEDVWPKMNERTLQAKHEIPIKKVDDASMRSLYWSLGGLVAMGTGIGVAAAVQDESGTAATIAAVSGLALGLVGVVGALAAQPSGADQLDAEARRSLLIRGEDDMRAAARGVNHANDQRRQHCGGPPSPPFVVPAPPPAPKTPPASPSAPPEAPPPAPVEDAPALTGSPTHAP